MSDREIENAAAACFATMRMQRAAESTHDWRTGEIEKIASAIKSALERDRIVGAAELQNAAARGRVA